MDHAQQRYIVHGCDAIEVQLKNYQLVAKIKINIQQHQIYTCQQIFTQTINASSTK